MRDFYRELGLHPDATKEEIESRLEQRSVEEPDEVRAVLLDPRRRQVYDRTLTTLREITKLRQKFGLRRTQFWDSEFDGVQGSTAWEELEDVPRWVVAFGVLMVLFTGFTLLANTASEPSTMNGGPRASIPEREPQGGLDRSVLDTLGNDQVKPGLPYNQPVPNLTPERPDDERAVTIVRRPVTPPPTGRISLSVETRYEAPFNIRTQGNQSHFFVKLEDLVTGETAATYFVQAGDRLDSNAPLGRYTLKYVTGENWYGPGDYFGAGSRYAVADQTLHFRIEGNRPAGYTVELFHQIEGNLPTRRISADEF